MTDRTLRVKYDRESEASASHQIINVISKITGRPVETLPPLFESINPDAVNSLFSREDSGKVLLTFTYCEHTITVMDDEGENLLTP